MFSELWDVGLGCWLSEQAETGLVSIWAYEQNQQIFNIWAQLFKANDVVKIYIEWYANMLKFFQHASMLKFFAEKCSFCCAKNIRILYIESAKTVNKMTLNELVKLTTLWTTGPWALQIPIFMAELRHHCSHVLRPHFAWHTFADIYLSDLSNLFAGASAQL